MAELDTYNINEATLFPELEHQLNYIKNKTNAETTNSPVEFTKFEINDTEENRDKLTFDISDRISEKEEFKSNVIAFLNEKYNSCKDEIWKSVEQMISIVDWSRQESKLSRFKVNIQKILLNDKFTKGELSGEGK